MKNENFKKRLALALVPILSLTSVIGNVPILPTSVFAVTIEEPAGEPTVAAETTTVATEEQVAETTTLEVEEPAAIEDETEDVLNEVPKEFQDLSVVNKDVLNADSTWTITGEAEGSSKLEYKVVGDALYATATVNTKFNFAGIGDTNGVTFKVTNGTNKQVKTFTYTADDDPEPITLTNGEATIPNAIAKTITAINLEFEPAYTISWGAVTGGTLKIGTDDSSPYTSNGTEITVTLTPATGKQVKTFTVGGEDKKGNLESNAYKFAPSADTEISVEFEDIPKPEEDDFTISWTVGTGGTLKIGTDEASPYTSDGTEITATITPPEGNRAIKTFTVAGADKKSDLKNGTNGTKTYKFTPTADTAIVVEFDDVVSELYISGTLKATFKDLAGVMTYINAQTTEADYTIDILDDIPSLALTLPAATKAKSITLKTAKAENAQATVAISNTTLAIPTELILDNVVLTSSGVNLTLSAADSALTVKAGGGIDKVVNVTTAANKVITLDDTTKFVVTGNLSGKPNITIKGNLEIAGTAAIGDLTYGAAATVTLKKAEVAASSIGKIVVDGDFVAVLKSSKLSLTIAEIDATKATTTGKGLTIQAIELGEKKYPVIKITGKVKKGKDPISLTLYTNNTYGTAATIAPSTTIITSVKTTKPADAKDTTGSMFTTLNKNGTADYAFYKDGTSLKLGNEFIALEAKKGAGTVEETFIRLQDAFKYIDDEKTLTDVILKVSGDTPSHGVILFPATEVTIQSSDDSKQYKVLFTGSVKLNANLTLKHIELSNSNIKGIAFDLNGKNLTLDTDSKVIFNNIVDTTKVTGTDTKASALNIKDAADLSFLGNINAIGNVNIEDDVIFKGAVANVELIDLKAAKYAYFRGGAITNKLKYVSNAKIYLQTTEKGAISKNITIKATKDAVTGTGKLKVNAVIDELTAAKDGLPEKITIKTAGGGSEKVIPGAVIVKLFKDSDAKAASFVTDAKNIKADTQTLIATKAGTTIKIAEPKLTLTDTTADATYVENFVTIEEALGVTLSGTTYKITITGDIVGADLSNIPAKITEITAAKPAEGKLPFKIVTAKDIGLNSGLIIENLNVLAAAKTIGVVITTGTGDTAVTTYTNATKDLLLKNTSLTVKEGYIKDLTLQDDAIITFKVSGYLETLILTKGSTVGKIASIPVPKT